MERYQSYRNRKTLSAHADSRKEGGGMQKRRAWISMPAQVEYQGAGASRMIGLSGFCVLSRAKESWLEALRDEERLKLEQPSVTFAGSFFSWSKKKKGRSQELDGGAAEGIGMSQFQILIYRLFKDGRSADEGSNVTDTERSTLLFVRLIH
jgi:hypothetical protein